MTAPQSPLNTPEGEAKLLQDLLSAERAGAKVAGDSLQEPCSNEQRQLLEQVRQGEIESCKLLLSCLQHLGLEPNKDTGAFYGKAMAIESLDERLPFIDKGQQWVIRKLREYLPGCQDPLLRSELERMLQIHEENSAAAHE
ncbi:MAG: diguanylate cyclase [Gammaproteobacteria bacterium HGW-Gammaproteobacteria-9]|nr:MAG: diguanylate cyclase [Gammaproteobacteria bacterium HGW-Gammaproteobacteria-9]